MGSNQSVEVEPSLSQTLWSSPRGWRPRSRRAMTASGLVHRRPTGPEWRWPQSGAGKAAHSRCGLRRSCRQIADRRKRRSQKSCPSFRWPLRSCQENNSNSGKSANRPGRRSAPAGFAGQRIVVIGDRDIGLCARGKISGRVNINFPAVGRERHPHVAGAGAVLNQREVD